MTKEITFEHIEITINGLVFHKWDSETRKYTSIVPDKMNIITYLRARCEIAQDATLKHIFKAVAEYDFLKLVIAQYSWCKQIDEFHAQAKEEAKSKIEESEIIDYLEIYHHPEIHKIVENKKHPGGLREKIITIDFDTSASFHGIGHVRDGSKINYSVSYSPMWELADLPVKLNKTFDIYQPFDPYKHNKDVQPEKIMSATREFTLLEVLDAIYWDISFAGGPSNNAEFLENMTKTVDDIKSGKVSLIPFEELLIDGP